MVATRRFAQLRRNGCPLKRRTRLVNRSVKATDYSASYSGSLSRELSQMQTSFLRRGALPSVRTNFSDGLSPKIRSLVARSRSSLPLVERRLQVHHCFVIALVSTWGPCQSRPETVFDRNALTCYDWSLRRVSSSSSVEVFLLRRGCKDECSAAVTRGTTLDGCTYPNTDPRAR